MWNRSRCLNVAKTTLTRLAALLLLTALAACVRPPDQVAQVGLASAPITLDPRYATDATSWRLCRLLFEAPAGFDAAFMPIPALMSWQQLGPRRYRFTLAGEHHFSDGTPLTTADVAATYRAVLDPTLASPHRASLANLARIDILDANRVEFSLHEPDPLFPGLLVIGVMPAAAAGLPATATPSVGSGAFVLAAPPSPKRYALQRLRDGQRVDFVVVENETTRVLKLARGELDLVQGSLAPENVAWLARQPHIAVSQQAGSTFSYLGFNLATGPTQALEVRQAIALAIDRAAIVDHVLRGQARLAEAILVPEHWAGAPALRPLPHDPARARALLLAMGYQPSKPLRLSYKTSSDPLRLRIAAILQAQLAEVGIQMDIQSYDWGTFYADIKAGRFALYGLSWVGLQLPDIFRYAFRSDSLPPAGANRGHYASVTADALIDAAQASPELAERAARYRELQDLLARDLPYGPLWYEDFMVVQRTRLVGYQTNASGDFDGLATVTLRPAQ